MTIHQHTECEHDLKYCKSCDIAYCTKCSKEWRTTTTNTFVPFCGNAINVPLSTNPNIVLCNGTNIHGNTDHLHTH